MGSNGCSDRKALPTSPRLSVLRFLNDYDKDFVVQRSTGLHFRIIVDKGGLSGSNGCSDRKELPKCPPVLENSFKRLLYHPFYELTTRFRVIRQFYMLWWSYSYPVLLRESFIDVKCLFGIYFHIEMHKHTPI